MSQEAVVLIDLATSQPVSAILDTEVSLVRVIEAEMRWMPLRLETLRQYVLSGGASPLPEQGHWNWALKALSFDPTVHRILGLECGGEMQGLIWMSRAGHQSRLPPDHGQPLVYVDFVETAPWNARGYTANPVYRGVGTRLLQAVVRQSQVEGFGGRVGLHSLSQAEPFYALGCGMVPLGPDPAHHNLAYFEFTSAAVATFLTR